MTSNISAEQDAPLPLRRYSMVSKTVCGEAWQDLEPDNEYGDWVPYEDAIADRDAALKDLSRAMGERNDKLQADFNAMVLACRQAVAERNTYALQLNTAIGGQRETFTLEQWLRQLSAELRATR